MSELPSNPADPDRRVARRSGGERAVMFLVLVVVGGAVGYAAFRASVGRTASELPEGDVQVVSKGGEVDLTTHAVEGKYTIYDFYADWCPPCRTLDVQLRHLASTHENVAIRKIDIIDWTTPVVAQHGVEGLPYMVLYGPDREVLASGDDVYLTVERLFDTVLE